METRLNSNRIIHIPFTDLNVRDEFACESFPMYVFMNLGETLIAFNQSTGNDFHISKDRTARLFKNKEVYVLKRSFNEKVHNSN